MDFIKRLKEHGQQNNLLEIQNLVKDISLDELRNIMRNQICRPTAIQVWNYLLMGFTDSSESHKKRYSITKLVLTEFKTADVTANHTDEIIMRLGRELPKFQSKHLMKLVDFCITCIHSPEHNTLCWKDLLPELLSVINERDKVTHNDTEMTGEEYKAQVINSLCLIKWSVNINTSLAAMFINVPLTKDEHFQVINKLGQCIEGLTPHEVPAFTYQMLRLCRLYNGKSLFLRLQNYFGKRLYTQLNGLTTDSDETTLNLDEIVNVSKLDAIEAEGTVLFHVHQAASLGHGSVKEYLNSLKVIVKSPEYLMHPFQMVVLLSISCVSQYEEIVLEILRPSISRAFHEDQRRLDSAWFREMAPAKTSFKNIFDIILNSKLKERELVVQGLLKLAFALLGVGAALGRDTVAEQQWRLGQIILVKLIRKHRVVAPEALKLLRNRILTENNIGQYTECIYQLCITSPLDLLDNENTIVQLIEQMVQMSSATSILVVRAVLPLMKISFTVRDSLILVLRKALYSRDIGTRQMAVHAFLQLLKNLKVNNLLALSQSQDAPSSLSGRSLLTQISIECRTPQAGRSVHSNEVLCLEVLSILRRSFMMQAEVKSQFYDGLCDAICKNPELETHILDILYIHIAQFYVDDDDTVPPLKLENIIRTVDVTAVLQEPLGKLLSVISSIVAQISHDEENPVRSLIRFRDILDSLVNRMVKCEVLTFGLDDGTDLSDIMPESQIKILQLKQILLTYEALMGYTIISWTHESESNSKNLLQLFKAYSRFVDFAKCLGKSKKSGAKRKRDDSLKKPVSESKLPPFKFPASVLNLSVIEKIFKLLYEDNVDWATRAQTNSLKTNRDFHRFIMHIADDLLLTIKSTKTSELQHGMDYFKSCTQIAKIIFERCIRRLDVLSDFDRQTAALSVELFYTILTIISTHKKHKLSLFYSCVGSTAETASLSEQIFPFIETFEELVEKEDVDADEEQGIKKTGVLMINIITLLVGHLPATSKNANQVLDWVKNVVIQIKDISKNTANALLNLLLTMQLRCKSTMQTRGYNATSIFDNVAAKISKVLGTIDHDDVNCVVALDIISNATVNNALQTLSSILKAQLDDVDWVILRLRADYSMVMYPGEDSPERKREKLKAKENDLCCYVCQIIEIAITISNTAVPSGPSSETILKMFGHLYNTLSNLTKYFLTRSTKACPIFQNARFERVVQVTGRQLSKNLFNMILFIEESQQPEEESSQAKKKKPNDPSQLKSKVLRETKFIPKVVYEMEQFGKCVIQLSNKTKVDLKGYIKHGTSRDFRIKTPALKEALENLNTSINSEISQGEEDKSAESVNNPNVSRENGDNTGSEDSS